MSSILNLNFIMYHHSLTVFKKLWFIVLISPQRVNCFFHFLFHYRIFWLNTVFTLKTLILLIFRTLKVSYFFTKIFLLLKKIFFFFRYYSLIFIIYKWFLILPKLFNYLLYKYKKIILLFIPLVSYSIQSIKKLKRIKKKLLKRIFIKN